MTHVPDEMVGRNQMLSSRDKSQPGNRPGVDRNDGCNDREEAANRETNHPEEDPVGGSRDTVDHEPERQGHARSDTSDEAVMICKYRSMKRPSFLNEARRECASLSAQIDLLGSTKSEGSYAQAETVFSPLHEGDLVFEAPLSVAQTLSHRTPV